ncbi:MAG: V-type ATP synthase subunit E [Treponema sp.]|jgi:V/A-type H+-transporting ATPase subunit E|nr:V-type ATP synthase subunit E [Treponema sp.]
MDIQVQELIDKIKKDGIESASEEASRIRREADAEAKQIVDAAKKEAGGIVAKGKQDAERFEKAGVAALGQASRNLVLAFKGEIQALLDKIVAEQLGKTYNDDILKAVIPELIKAWPGKKSDSLAILVSEASLTKLKTAFKTKLAVELKKGLELKSDRNLTGGFRIAHKDGSAYYDFSADSVAEMLCAYLNPRLAEILKSSAKDQ